MRPPGVAEGVALTVSITRFVIWLLLAFRVLVKGEMSVAALPVKWSCSAFMSADVPVVPATKVL